jgi:hypothetical protein
MTMDDVDRLLREFIQEDRSAPADPLPYLEQLEGTDRAELEALIDGYLARAPRRPFDAQAFDRSPARGVAEELGRALGGVSGTWPALLPRLRHRARLRRADVVQRLAEELGADERQVEKVARYYHEMEQGMLPSAQVSERVLEALGRVLGVTAGRLADAGRRAGGGVWEPGEAAAFARVGSPDPAQMESEAPGHGPVPSRDGPPDEIDALFTGASAEPV